MSLRYRNSVYEEWLKKNPNASYADKLGMIAISSHMPEKPPIEDFIKGFDMIPDTKAQILRLYNTNESFYRNFSTDAFPRIIANIKYALKHKGSTLINVSGNPRHGKSTVGRFLARLIHQYRHGHIDHWEQNVIYEQSYSGSTNRLIERVKTLQKQGLTNQEIIQKLQGHIFISDEVLIEHEKGSVKARHDVLNLVETCAAAGIDFIFITPTRREFGQFVIWTVGIDPRRKANLSFYFDNEGFCFGYLLSENVPESPYYQESKTDGIMEMLSMGGRRVAESKPFERKTDPLAINERIVEGVAPDQLLKELFKIANLPFDRHHRRNIKIFNDIAIRGYSINRVAMNNKMTNARIYQISGLISEAVGKAFEKYLATIQPQLWKRQGGKSEPDLINSDHKFCVSCKVMFGDKAKKTDKAIRNSRPEISMKRQGYKVFLIIFWIDTNTFTLQEL